MTDHSGQYFGRYYLAERLGEGGMAVVYKAYDTRLERDVAIKIIRREAFSEEALDEVLKRFERDNDLPADGKLDSLTLIMLGLGPKRLASVSGEARQ